MSDEQTPSRYVVGIDLGTTNSAVFRVDTEVQPWSLEVFPIPQLTAASTIERLDSLPSFHFEPVAADRDGGALDLPWESRFDGVVGTLARERGADVPSRLIASAKSWLSHSGVDRTAALLPWHGAADIKKLSPKDVSCRYLDHIRLSWDSLHPEHPLAEQDVVLTVPASFDEIARELTVAAAKAAGLPRVFLIEEPQAAFYAWIHRRTEAEEAPLEADQTVLVVDVGGGTTDLTLIRVEGGEDGGLRFRRIAVGDHLILGGDNLDLALAQHLETKLSSQGLDRRQWSVLIHRARQAKEAFLGKAPPESLTITLPGGGSRLLGGALTTRVEREEVQQLLIEGFLPRVTLTAEPAPRASGFRELGLPYAPDSGITRYLAQFLRAHGQADGVGAGLRPDAVLFNGGFFAGRALRDRVLEVLASWFGDSTFGDSTLGDSNGSWQPRVLRSERLDLAVAQGAAYFGMVRRGEGERIQGGLAHAYYVGAKEQAEQAERADGEPAAEPESRALCLVPAGLEEGREVTLEDRDFELLIREPVEFPIFTSSTRSGDRPGDLIEVDPEQLRALPPIRTVLRSGKKKGAEKVRVKVHARLTEIGTLSVWCSEAGGNRSWRLEFDVRSAVQTDAVEHQGAGEAVGIVPEETVIECQRLIAETFGRDGKKARPDQLVRRLEEATGQGRWDWPPALLRDLWQALIQHQNGRSLSIAHEARWLNLLGFSLRPGFGVAVDDWRMARTWQLSHRKLVHPRNEMCRGEWWVLWRRLSAGLTAGQQQALAQPLLAGLRSAAPAKRRQRLHEAAEIERLLASLEWLEPSIKQQLSERALEALEAEGPKASSGSRHWALARLAARVPVYGPPNRVIEPELVESWLERIMAIRQDRGVLAFAVMQMARRTDDRFRDISSTARSQVCDWLAAVGAPEHYGTLVRDGGELESGDERLVFGDSLPAGLTIQ
ncbi:MAG: Hsp70 family protein [Acidobacteriota bacterium]